MSVRALCVAAGLGWAAAMCWKPSAETMQHRMAQDAAYAAHAERTQAELRRQRDAAIADQIEAARNHTDYDMNHGLVGRLARARIADPASVGMSDRATAEGE